MRRGVMSKIAKAKTVRLRAINCPRKVIETCLSVSCCWAFDPTPYQDLGGCIPFDFAREQAGLIVFLNDNGSARRIVATRNLRAYLTSAYKGYEGPDAMDCYLFAFEESGHPEQRAADLSRENLLFYGSFSRVLRTV